MAGVNRTDRLYALVEELRASAPRPRSASWLARRFEVSVRTVERDLDALRQADVPIWSEAGRRGGYTVDRSRTLPPLTLTADEAFAISVALRAVEGSPFAAAARRAAQKVRAVLPTEVLAQEADMVRTTHRVGEHASPTSRVDVGLLEDAIAAVRVVHLAYTDAAGVRTERDVEPWDLLWGPRGWYLMAWCRLRGAVRGFDLDRIAAALPRDERAPRRDAERRAELARLDAQPFER